LAIDKALDANMTKETIDRAAKKGAGELDGVNYDCSATNTITLVASFFIIHPI
jgi:transcriptional/translational regulatory protein YebC/TACO1